MYPRTSHTPSEKTRTDEGDERRSFESEKRLFVIQPEGFVIAQAEDTRLKSSSVVK